MTGNTRKDHRVPLEWLVGQTCTVNGVGDLFMEYDARPFLGSACVVVKITKSGLIQVALKTDPKMVYSFPKRNIDLLPNLK